METSEATKQSETSDPQANDETEVQEDHSRTGGTEEPTSKANKEVGEAAQSTGEEKVKDDEDSPLSVPQEEAGVTDNDTQEEKTEEVEKIKPKPEESQSRPKDKTSDQQDPMEPRLSVLEEMEDLLVKQQNAHVSDVLIDTDICYISDDDADDATQDTVPFVTTFSGEDPDEGEEGLGDTKTLLGGDITSTKQKTPPKLQIQTSNNEDNDACSISSDSTEALNEKRGHERRCGIVICMLGFLGIIVALVFLTLGFLTNNDNDSKENTHVPTTPPTSSIPTVPAPPSVLVNPPTSPNTSAPTPASEAATTTETDFTDKDDTVTLAPSMAVPNLRKLRQ